MLTLKIVTDRDVKIVAENLRQADLNEIREWGYVDPLAAIRVSVFRSSECYAVCFDRVPCGLVGVTSDSQVWMVGTDLLTLRWSEFLRGCLDLLPLITRKHERLWNQVYAENRLHVAWLRWLGFTLTMSPIPHFLEFSAPCVSLRRSRSQPPSRGSRPPQPDTPASESQPPPSPSSRTNNTPRSAEPLSKPTDAT